MRRGERREEATNQRPTQSYYAAKAHVAYIMRERYELKSSYGGVMDRKREISFINQTQPLNAMAVTHSSMKPSGNADTVAILHRAPELPWHRV